MSIKTILGCKNFIHLAKRIFASAHSPSSFGMAGLFLCDYDGIQFFLKVAPLLFLEYDKFKEPPAPFLLPAETEHVVLGAVKSAIIDEGISPHFVEQLFATRCKTEELAAQARKCISARADEEQDANARDLSQLLDAYAEAAARGVARDHVFISLQEMCDLDLRGFVAQHLPLSAGECEEIVAGITFQILFSLFALVRVFGKTFEHGDMGNPTNILFVDASEDESRALAGFATDSHHTYCAQSLARKWNIPWRGYWVKIADFGHSYAPQLGAVSAVIQNREENRDSSAQCENAARDAHEFTQMFAQLLGDRCPPRLREIATRTARVDELLCDDFFERFASAQATAQAKKEFTIP